MCAVIMILAYSVFHYVPFHNFQCGFSWIIFSEGAEKLFRVLATVKNSVVNTAFPILLLVELPNLCFPNTQRLPKCKNR